MRMETTLCSETSVKITKVLRIPTQKIGTYNIEVYLKDRSDEVTDWIFQA
jgi:hypothetical protein